MGPDDRIAFEKLTERLAGLESRLQRVEERLGALLQGEYEPGASAAEAPPAATPVPVPVARAGADAGASSELLPLYGRTLLLFAGAFLIRALTEGGVLPDRAGTWIGVVYALVLLALADRTAARRRTSATFYGLAGVGIAFPLVWEATARFGFLSPRGGAVALALLATASIWVVARRELHALAWLVAAGGCGAALALALGTHAWGPYVLELLLMAAAFAAVAPRRGWLGLQAVTGLVAIACLAMMSVTLELSPPDRVAALFSPATLLWLQLGWVLAFFGLLASRTLVHGEEVRAVDAGLSILTLAAGFGGALALNWRHEVSQAPLEITSVVLAVGAYAVAFAFVDRRLGRVNFAFYTTFALVVTLVAGGALLRGGALALLLVALSGTAGVLGSMRGRATLTVHSAVYLIAALAASGGLGAIVDAFSGPGPRSSGWLTLPTVAALAVALLDAWLPASTEGRTWGWFARVPRVVIDAVVLFGLAAIVIGLVTPSGAETAPDAALLAALRSTALAAIVILAAWASGRPRWPEASWLVYPLLVLGGVKLLLVDLPEGRPATLVLSFIVYGAALILAPRLGRRAAEASA